MNRLFLLLMIAFFAHPVFANTTVEVYPLNWFTGMKNGQLQLMIHHPDIATGATVKLSYPGVQLVKTNKVDNSNYLFLDLVISAAAKPGTFDISIQKKDSSLTIPYELKARRSGNGSHYAQGVNASDFVYLLMPDRFSNGDPCNDRVAGTA